MILGSHNSWSYLPPKHWWMWPFYFMAKCQRVDIREQYEKYGVRCFDLRVRWKKWKMQVAHGLVVYDISEQQLKDDLAFLNDKGDCFVRIIHEVRTKKQYEKSVEFFRSFCYVSVSEYPNIKFWCGRNLCDWTCDYSFRCHPTCDEKYSSVCYPRIIDDWWPWLYAVIRNKGNLAKGTKDDILLIDFIDIR